MRDVRRAQIDRLATSPQWQATGFANLCCPLRAR
jgi:hypothetical protein